MTLKNLIRLDFYAMKPLAKTMLCFLIVPIILGVVTQPGISIMITLTFVVFMLNMVFAIAEKSNFSKLYGVLPIRSSQPILSRYLFSLIIVSCTAVFAFLIYLILSITLDGSINWISGISFLTISIMISLFFISVQYPFYFKFEYSKATIMSILPYLICFAIGAPLLQYLMGNPDFYAFSMKVILYFQSNVLILVLLGTAISLLMIFISYSISLHIQKKDI